MDARQGSIRDAVTIDIKVAMKLLHLFELFSCQDLTPIRHLAGVKLKVRNHPVVHPDIQVGHHDDRCLQALRVVKSGLRHGEAFVRVPWKEQHMLGVAMRGIGATHDVRLLRARRHTRGWAGALHIENDRGNFRVIRKANEFTHQRYAGTAGGGKGSRAVPGRSQHHANRCQFVFGLDNAIGVLAGFLVDPIPRAKRVHQ